MTKVDERIFESAPSQFMDLEFMKSLNRFKIPVKLEHAPYLHKSKPKFLFSRKRTYWTRIPTSFNEVLGPDGTYWWRSHRYGEDVFECDYRRKEPMTGIEWMGAEPQINIWHEEPWQRK